jgi:rhamnose ABC transporter rhamnose-binding protein
MKPLRLLVASLALLLFAAAAAQTIAMVPKFTNAEYFTATRLGGEEAAAELGFDFIFEGTVNADIDGQIQIIDSLIARGVDALIVSPNDPDAIIPVLQRAQAAGIPVVTYDADASGDRDFFMNQATFDSVGHALIDALAAEAGEDARYAIVSATPTAANQNAWIESMQAYSASDYPELDLVTIQYGDDEPQKSFQVAQDLLNAYPDLDAIISPTSVGFPAAAEAVEQAGLSGEVAVIGLATPNAMREFVKGGTVTSDFLWNPIDLGYASVFAAKALLDGLEAGQSFDAGRLGSYTAEADEQSLTTLLGPPYRFSLDNIDDFDF